MFALALVLIALGAVLGVVGALALAHRLPRNRVVGVRTTWTLARVDTFRRANHAAGPAFVAAGGIGVVGGLGAAVSSGAAAVTLLVCGVVGLVVLFGAAGAIGARYAAADEAAEVAAAAPGGPCTLDAGPDAPDGDPTSAPTDGPAACAPSSCGGACSLCPRGTGPDARADAPADRSAG